MKISIVIWGCRQQFYRVYPDNINNVIINNTIRFFYLFYVEFLFYFVRQIFDNLEEQRFVRLFVGIRFFIENFKVFV